MIAATERSTVLIAKPTSAMACIVSIPFAYTRRASAVSRGLPPYTTLNVSAHQERGQQLIRSPVRLARVSRRPRLECPLLPRGEKGSSEQVQLDAWGQSVL